MHKPIFYDSSIIGFLLVVGSVIAWLALNPQSLPRPTQQILLWSAVVGWITIFYGSFIEPRFLVVKQTKIQLQSTETKAARHTAKTPSNEPKPGTRPLRLGLITDLQVGPYKKRAFVEKVVKKMMEEKPDIILIGGDHVDDFEVKISYLEPLKELHAPLGVFAVLGNHDYGIDEHGDQYAPHNYAEELTERFKDWGIEMLINEGRLIRDGDRAFGLLGTDDIWTGRADVATALSQLASPSDTPAEPLPIIILSHNPEIVNSTGRLRADLILSGHTHGGQIRLPFLGAVPPLPHKLGRQFDKGLFTVGKSQLYISSGVGESGVRARLFVPPSIDLLEIEF
ncbi:hypothetical protein CO046_00840 [Candidatus Peregrinibacteria bacterium CG_4_9_14_0_2_um_filter_53_11]|nr:MAG: hypothetical protein CO046_00840 [Candidatus Peregrinibacteria bacterium CG_4_9_14_0_2_um_filter_53_11]